MASSSFQARLRKLIDRAGGQAALARLAGVTQPAVSGWLSGSTPLRRTIAPACQSLGVNLKWLLDGEGEMEVDDADNEPKESDALPIVSKNDGDLARSLADMVVGFCDIPPAFQRGAFLDMEAHWSEFQRRCRMHMTPPKKGK